jgi:large subunit ribosomal protein L18
MARKTSYSRRLARHKRVRRKISGTGEQPRLAVFRSLNHIHAQLIDDVEGITLAAASSAEPHVLSQSDGKRKSEVSSTVGALIAERAKENGIKSVVFDRGGHQYHGRIKALAEAARKGGLSF